MEFIKKNWSTILIAVATIILAAVAVFTALRLYQLRQESVSPTTPESEPAAQTTCTSTQCLDQASNTCLDVSQQSNTACGTGGSACQVCATGEYCNNGACESTACNTITFSLAVNLTEVQRKQPTPTSTPTITPTPTSSTPKDLVCGDVCDTNNSKCPTSAPYCIDYTTDNLPARCGTTQSATAGPSCSAVTPTPTTTPQTTPVSQPELPAAGVSTPTIVGAGAGILLLIFALALAL